MSAEEPARKRSRSSRWGGDDAEPQQPAAGAAIAPPPGMGIGLPPGMGLPPAMNAPPPPPPPQAHVAHVINVPPPPPPPSTMMAGGGAPASATAPGSGVGSGVGVGGSGVATMSVEAAKAAAAKAAAAIQAQLGVNLGVSVPGFDVGASAGGDDAGRGAGDEGVGGGDAASLIDLSGTYPGVPPGWGAGLNESQLRAAYQQHTRQSRRLYVGSIPQGTQNFDVQRFFNDAMLTSGAAVNPAAGAPVLQVTINHEKGFGFVEFSAMEDAESALMFDGIVFNGAKLKVSRPKDYDAAKNPLVMMRGGPEAAAGGGAGEGQLLLGGRGEGAGGSGAAAEEVKLNPPPPLLSEWPRLPKRTPDGPYKLYVGGFDPLHTEWQVRQLLQAVGPLKSFAAMPDAAGKSAGHAFFEYEDPRLTAAAEAAVTGVALLGKRLVCRRATPDAAPEVAGSGALATYRVPGEALPLLEPPSRRLAVHNAVTAEHDAAAAAEVEAAVAREAAAVAEWDPGSVSSRRDHPDGRITLVFEEGGGGWSGVGGGALDAAARCSADLNGGGSVSPSRVSPGVSHGSFLISPATDEELLLPLRARLNHSFLPPRPRKA